MYIAIDICMYVHGHVHLSLFANDKLVISETVNVLYKESQT